jgi:hypothetical protein
MTATFNIRVPALSVFSTPKYLRDMKFLVHDVQNCGNSAQHCSEQVRAMMPG